MSLPVFAGEVAGEAPEAGVLERWWEGKHGTGDWFGARTTLEERGIKLGGEWTGTYYGVVDGGKPGVSGGFFDEELKFWGEANFAKLTGWEAIEGLSGFGEVRWRDGVNPNVRVGAFSTFAPSDFQSGKQWRLTQFGATYVTPELFGIKDFLGVTGGWIRPQKYFVEQPQSKFFVNNAVRSSKGLGGNIPFSSSFSSWGGVVTLRPVSWHYARAGFFMAYPQATSTKNHGLAFEGFGPDPSQNGFFFMGETGFTPAIGSAKLPGKYAFGAYSYGQWNDSFNGERYANRYGFYWQMDQMLYREPAARAEPAPSDGKSKVVAPPEKPALGNQGLSFIGLVSYAPKYNNILPFYFHSALVYQGLIPTRDNDLTMFSFALGQYSAGNIGALQRDGIANQPSYSAVLEWDYRIRLNQWAYAQPYIQYIIQPNGTSAIENATVMGVMLGVTF